MHLLLHHKYFLFSVCVCVRAGVYVAAYYKLKMFTAYDIIFSLRE